MKSVNPDFNAPDVIANPFPSLATMRSTNKILWNDSLRGWCATGYEDVRQAFTDKRLSAERIQPFLENDSVTSREVLDQLGAVFLLWLPFIDPPRHTRLRKLLSKGFSGRAIAKLPEKIHKVVKELVGHFPVQGEIDLIRDFATPLPGIVIADVLGVPQDDVGQLKIWSDDIAAFILNSRLIENKYEIAAKATSDMGKYFSELIDARMQSPGTAIIDELIEAHEGDDYLSREELLSSCVLLLFAGHETTTQLFGNGALAFLQHPCQMDDFQRNLGDTQLLENSVEEILRWNGPTVATVRIMREAAVFKGVSIPKGDRLHLFIGGANRDPRLFHDPDKFDIRRPNARKQINFGYGAHMCLGARLARMEGVIGFSELVPVLNTARLISEDQEWSDSLVVRGLKSLNVQL